jgi:hypothetical protein
MKTNKLKRVFMTLAVLSFVSVSSSAEEPQEYVYLPKSITCTSTTSENKIEEKYSFDNNFRLTEATYTRRTPDNKYFYDDYRLSVNISYDKKTGQVKKANIMSRKMDISNGDSYDDDVFYTFSYDVPGVINVKAKTHKRDGPKEDVYKKDIDGDIDINEQGEMIGAGVYALFVKDIDYDANKNPIQIRHGSARIEINGYDSKNGIFKDSNTPQWLSHFLFDNHESILYYLLNKCTRVNNITEAKIETDEDTSLQSISYDYNEDGYPVAYKSHRVNEDKNVEFNFSGVITYDKKKKK